MMGKFLPVIVALVGSAAVTIWWSSQPAVTLEKRVPGRDRVPVETDAGLVRPYDRGNVSHYAEGAPPIQGVWPGFRGAHRDGISREDIALHRQWPERGPRKLWDVQVGEGYAGPAIADNRVYLMDYDREAQADALRCFALATGEELWRFSYSLKVKRNHGMSRTVPAIADGRVVAIGPLCHVICLDSQTGAFEWGLDLVADFGATVPPWYAGQCPLIDDGRVILGVGGDHLLMAIDLLDGTVIWESPNPRRWQMTHASIVPFEHGGNRAYLYLGSGGIAAVDAETGELLWDSDQWQISIATISSPVVVDAQRIFLAGGYNAGAMMLGLNNGRPEPLYRLKPSVFGATQQTPILYRDHLYGIRPNGQLVCLDLAGTILWDSGKERFGLGPFLIADGLLFAMDDSGLLSMAQADPSAFRLLAQAQIFDGHDCWGPMALAGGHLLVRDFTTLACLDVGIPERSP